MRCRFCGTQLPENGIYCPQCAKVTPYGISQSQVMPDIPTSVASPSYPPPPIATNYGSFPYRGTVQNHSGTVQNPYEPSDPYIELQQAPKKKSRVKRIAAIVLLIIVISMSGIVFHTYNTRTSPTAGYPFSTALMLNDPLNIANNANGWDTSNSSDGRCAFTSGAYEITTYHNHETQFCVAEAINVSNFTYEVQMTIKNGGAGAMGGVVFRDTQGTARHYVFALGTDGSYNLTAKTDPTTGNTLRTGMITGFITGFNHPHTIGIVARGSQISIYVDHNQIIQLSDTTYASGTIGMISRYGTSNTTADYTNAKVWQL